MSQPRPDPRRHQHDGRMTGSDQRLDGRGDAFVDRIDDRRGGADDQPAFAVFDPGGDLVFQLRVQRQDVDRAVGGGVPGADRAGQPMPDEFGQQHRILGPRGVIAQRFEDHRQLFDRDVLPQQPRQHGLQLRDPHDAGDQIVDDRRRRFLQFVDQVFDRVAGEQFVGVAAGGFLQVRRQDGAGVDGGVTVDRGLLAADGVDPHRGAAERGVLGRLALDDAGGRSVVDGQQFVGEHGVAGDRVSRDADAVLELAQRRVVTHADFGQDHADVAGQRVADPGDALHQVAALGRVGQRQQPQSDRQPHRVDGQHVLDAFLRRGVLRGGLFGVAALLGVRGALGFTVHHDRQPDAPES